MSPANKLVSIYKLKITILVSSFYNSTSSNGGRSDMRFIAQSKSAADFCEKYLDLSSRLTCAWVILSSNENYTLGLKDESHFICFI